MKKMKGLIVLISCVVIMLIFVGIVHSESVNDINQSGTSGDCTWEITNGGALTVKPTTGSSCTLATFSGNESGAPWFEYMESLTSAKFQGTVNANSNIGGMFNGAINLKTVNFNNFNTANTTGMALLFKNASSLESVNVEVLNTSKVENMNSMFYGCSKLRTLNVSSWNTSSVTNMGSMFRGCEELETLDVSHFNTSKVENMNSVFYDCKKLRSINVSSWNTSSATNMGSMFRGCEALKTLDVTSFDTSNVTSFASMFDGCKNLQSIDVTHFNTSNATSMASMFNSCESIKSIDVSNFDTSKVTTMATMFSNCKNLTELDVRNFSTESIVEKGLSRTFGTTFGNIPYVKKITLGSNFDYKFGELPSGGFFRGTWLREEDNKEYTGVEITKNTSLGKGAGTYSYVSSISQEINASYPVNYKIGQLSKIDHFSTTSPTFTFDSENNKVHLNVNLTEEVEDYAVDGSFSVIFDDIVSDKDDNTYNMKVTVENVHLYKTLSKKNTQYDSILMISQNNSLMLQREADASQISARVTIELIDDNNNPLDGNFLFSAYHIDQVEESLKLESGFDLDTLSVADDSYLDVVDNVITGNVATPGNELAEFSVKTSSSKIVFDWTDNANTDFFIYYQPLNVYFSKVDQYNKYVPGAELELYHVLKNGRELVESWTTTNEAKKLFLSPAEYELVEKKVPYGYNSASSIKFFVDINNQLTTNGKNVDRIIMKDNRIESPGVIAHYYLENTTTKLADDVEIKGFVGESYSTTSMVEDDRYELLEIPSNASGVLKEGVQEVIYYYRLREYKYTINHIDKETNKLLDTVEDIATFKDVISALDFIKKFDGYNFSNYSTKSIVVSEDMNKNVINLYYITAKNIVTAKYIDKDSDKLLDIEVIKDKIGEKYNTVQKDFDNYKFVEVVGDTSGVISDVEAYVTYYYERVYNVITSIENGVIDESVSNINKGGTVSIKFKPNKGYYISKIMIDGKEVDTKNIGDSYTFDGIISDHEIKVFCTLNPPTGAHANIILYSAVAFVALWMIMVFKKRSKFFKI